MIKREENGKEGKIVERGKRKEMQKCKNKLKMNKNK
jgi:hypothetical protein